MPLRHLNELHMDWLTTFRLSAFSGVGAATVGLIGEVNHASPYWWVPLATAAIGAMGGPVINAALRAFGRWRKGEALMAEVSRLSEENARLREMIQVENAEPRVGIDKS